MPVVFDALAFASLAVVLVGYIWLGKRSLAAVAHPYKAQAVLFPDGRVVTWELERMDAMADKTLRLLEASETPKQRTIASFENAELPTRDVRRWAEDLSFVLDELGRLNSVEPEGLHGHQDLSRVGVFGHSLGGGAAGQACMPDPRVGTCLNMDGPQRGGMVHHTATKPVMFMTSEENVGMNDLQYRSAQGPAYSQHVEGARHLDFSDQPLWSPLMQVIGVAGPIGGHRAVETVNTYTLAFFDRHLRDLDSPLLTAPSTDFPEVIMQVRADER